MSKVRVAVLGSVGKSVSFNPDATVGSTLETDFKLPDGSTATKATLAAYLGVGASSSGVTQHRLLVGLTVGDDHPQYTRKDTLTARGDMYVRNSTTVGRVGLGSNGQFWQAGTADPSWQTISPVVTLSTDLSGNTTLTNLTSGTLAATIVSHAVTNSKFRQSSALSVVGNSTNATADVADIAATSDAQVLRRSGTAVGFGAIDLSSTNAVSNRLAYANVAQGSALSVLGVTGNATADVANIAATADTTVLRRAGTAVAFGAIDHTYISDFSSAVPQAANPTASVGLVAVNGSAATFMRSDAAPALSQAIVPTWSGTHTFSVLPVLPNQSANKILAGPATGAAATPAFRSLVDADIPTTLSLTTATSLVSVGTITTGTWSATAVIETKGGTNQTSYMLGDTLYASAANTLSKLAGNTTSTKKFLQQTGTGSVSAAPAWGTLASGDIPDLGANPSASVGLTAVNGSAATYMRSDGAPALDQGIAPTWTGYHTFTAISGRYFGLYEPAAGTDAKNTIWRSGGSGFNISSAADATPTTAVQNAWVAIRTGTAWTTISIGNTTNLPNINLRGQVRAQSGTVSAPAYTFEAETSTGIYLIGASNIGLTLGGALNVDFSANRSYFQSPVRLPNSTVGGLIAAGTAGAGALAFVTDATLTAITGLGLAVTGGGANKVPVYSDGTNWIII